MANELNPEFILATQIVLSLFVLVITLLLALPRLQQVKLVLKLIFEVVRTLLSIAVLLLRLIRDVQRIISMTHYGLQQVVSILELINDVVGSLANLDVLLLQLISICRSIWSIWTTSQPVVVANDHQNEVPLVDAKGDAKAFGSF